MEASLNYSEFDSLRNVKNDTTFTFEITKQDTVEKLKERIAELEQELRKQKEAAERGLRLLNVMWGDDFNDESLH